MLILAAHTATPSLGVAVTKDGEILSEKVLSPGRQHLENLPNLIQQVLIASNRELSNFDGFAVAIGPGSFSGIRVGLSVIKGLALALGKKVLGVSTLEILAWQLQVEDEDKLVAPVIDAGRGDIYTAVFEKREGDVREVLPPCLMNRDEIRNLKSVVGVKYLTVCGSRELSDLIDEDGGFKYREIDFASPGRLGCLAETRLEKGFFDDVHMLVPLYVRRSDAEEKKKTEPYRSA